MAKESRENGSSISDDENIESEMSKKELRAQQEELLKLVDNYEMLCSYGIDAT